MAETESTLYELSFLINPEEAENAEVRERLRKHIEGQRGMILEEGALKKIRPGIFGYIKFILKPAELEELRAGLLKEKGVLRHFLLKSERPEARNPLRRRTLAGKRESADIASIDKKLEEILGK